MAPDKELVESIQKSVLSYDNICGVHDLMIHNYGPGRIIASIHAEVPCNISIVKIHEIIDKAEKEVSKELDIYLVIHMDPINTNSEDVLKDRNILDEVLKNFPIIKSIHDFRVVGEGEIKNLIFDAVIDVSHHLSKDEEHKLIKDIDNSIKKIHSKYNVIITIDKDYLGVE